MGFADLDKADATTLAAAAFDLGESVTYYPTGKPAGSPETIDVIVFRDEPERLDDAGRMHEALVKMPAEASGNAPTTDSEFDLVVRLGDGAVQVRVSKVGAVGDGFFTLFVNR